MVSKIIIILCILYTSKGLGSVVFLIWSPMLHLKKNLEKYKYYFNKNVNGMFVYLYAFTPSLVIQDIKNFYSEDWCFNCVNHCLMHSLWMLEEHSTALQNCISVCREDKMYNKNLPLLKIYRESRWKRVARTRPHCCTA